MKNISTIENDMSPPSNVNDQKAKVVKKMTCTFLGIKPQSVKCRNRQINEKCIYSIEQVFHGCIFVSLLLLITLSLRYHYNASCCGNNTCIDLDLMDIGRYNLPTRIIMP